MIQEDIEVLSQIGQVLWVNSNDSERYTVETLSAASLLQLTPERTLERASIALLERARREGFQSQFYQKPELLNQSFYRLTPEEKLLLVTLHLGKWSYDRISRILQRSVEEVQELAWNARLKLNGDAAYPAGPSRLGPTCPDYFPRRPWTQRFLDGEISSGRERLFLQNHLLSCEACHQTLARSREMYFRIDRQVRAFPIQKSLAHLLGKVLQQSPNYAFPSQRTVQESLTIFFERPDVRWAALILLVLFSLKIFGCFHLFSSS